jgi:hypothetical protein
MKKIVLRCVTGGYENIRPVKNPQPGWEYICITDDPHVRGAGWKMKLIDNPDNLDSVRLARRVKIVFWEYTGPCDICVWVDGNVDIIGDLDSFCTRTGAWDTDMLVKRHPQRNCVYQEYMACKGLSKDDPIIMRNQVKGYEKEGFPQHFGLAETNVLVRKPTQAIKDLMSRWFIEVQNKSRRDQLSFTYLLWKLGCEDLVKFSHHDNYARYFLKTGLHR